MAEIELSRLTDMKEEVEDILQTGTDAPCVKEEETGQEAPSQTTDWFKVILLDVNAGDPFQQIDATIRIIVEQVPDSTASKFIARHPELVGQTMVVNTDSLRPMPGAVKTVKNKNVECDPSNQLVGVTIGPWNPDGMHKDFIKHAVNHSLQWLHSSTLSSIGGVEAFHDDTVSSSTVLQVRATREFKKGELWLCPHGGTLVCETDKEDQFRDVDESCQKDGKTMHKGLTRFLSITTSTGQPVDKRKSQNGEKKMQPITMNFRLVSPLVQSKTGKKAYKDNLAPFWALTPGADADGGTNMRIEEYVVKDKGPEAVKLGYINGKKPKSSRELTMGKQFETTITVPLATNNTHIAIGEILCIPKGALASGSEPGSQPSDSAMLGS